ncbi:hypothetical protein ACHAXR_001340 [Thalassiosira sp. AJA248-18]
MDHI